LQKKYREISLGRSLMASSLLRIPAAGYHLVQKLREQTYRMGLLQSVVPPVPVISVGNLLLGGSGKTPFVIYLAELLSREGFKPAVVSRGYKGSNRDDFLVVGDGTSSTPMVDPSVSGDEPYLIATRLPQVPVIIGKKRIHPVRAAHSLFGVDAVILDDGFQHLPLDRGLDIVLMNGTEDHMFPFGSLREPLSALKRADIIILSGIESVPPAALPYTERAAVFHCSFESDILLTYEGSVPGSQFSGKEVVLMSAIAGPERFRKTAEQLGWVIKDHVVFPDHHTPDDSQLEHVLNRAGESGVIMTEKDRVKLPLWFLQKANVFTLRLRTVVREEEQLISLLRRTITAN
jgi:tetraacyldisaccharide 4'-kinase